MMPGKRRRVYYRVPPLRFRLPGAATPPLLRYANATGLAASAAPAAPPYRRRRRAAAAAAAWRSPSAQASRQSDAAATATAATAATAAEQATKPPRRLHDRCRLASTRTSGAPSRARARTRRR